MKYKINGVTFSVESKKIMLHPQSSKYKGHNGTLIRIMNHPPQLTMWFPIDVVNEPRLATCLEMVHVMMSNTLNEDNCAMYSAMLLASLSALVHKGAIPSPILPNVVRPN